MGSNLLRGYPFVCAFFFQNSIQIVVKKSEKNIDNVEYSDMYRSIKNQVQIQSTHRKDKIRREQYIAIHTLNLSFLYVDV